MRKSIKLSAAALVLALSLAGCGSGDTGVDSITYSENGDQAPTVSFKTPLKADDAESKVLKDGDGEDIKDGDTLVVESEVYDGKDASKKYDSYASEPGTIVVGDKLKSAAPEVYDILTKAKVGAAFAYVPKAESSDSASPVQIYQVKKKVLKQAEGKSVAPQAGLPTVTITSGKDPKITIPKDQAEPTTLTSQNLIDGTGEQIKDNEKVFVKYAGVQWSNGKQFDSNWTGDPAEFSLSQVIPGWTEGLKGKHVGDRVLLVVPADKAYGTAAELKAKKSSSPSGALVFVVDVLGTVRAGTDAQSTSSASASPSTAASAQATQATPVPSATK